MIMSTAERVPNQAEVRIAVIGPLRQEISPMAVRRVRARRAYQNWPWNTFNPTRHARDGVWSLRRGDVAHGRSPGMGIARFGFHPGERSPGTWQCSRRDCSRSSQRERYAGRWCDQIRNSLATSHKGLRSPAGCTGRPAKYWLRDYEARSRKACECDGCDKVA